MSKYCLRNLESILTLIFLIFYCIYKPLLYHLNYYGYLGCPPKCLNSIMSANVYLVNPKDNRFGAIILLFCFIFTWLPLFATVRGYFFFCVVQVMDEIIFFLNYNICLSLLLKFHKFNENNPVLEPFKNDLCIIFV